MPPAPGNDAERDFRHAEARAGRRNPVVTSERDLQAAAHDRAVHGRDDRERQRFVAIEQAAVLLFLRRPAELADVRAGEERGSLAQQHDGPNALRSADLVQARLAARRGPRR